MATLSVEDLRNYLECPICLETPNRPPIFQCNKGHLICSSCRPRVRVCPVCRVRLPSISNTNRLLFAERLVQDRLPVPCKYADDGCPVELVSTPLARHEEDCPFRPRSCPNRNKGCKQLVTDKTCKDHMAKCRYRIVECPIQDCSIQKQIQIIAKDLEIHLREEHFTQDAFGPLTTHQLIVILISLCLVSFAVNFILLWQGI